MNINNQDIWIIRHNVGRTITWSYVWDRENGDITAVKWCLTTVKEIIGVFRDAKSFAAHLKISRGHILINTDDHDWWYNYSRWPFEDSLRKGIVAWSPVDANNSAEELKSWAFMLAYDLWETVLKSNMPVEVIGRANSPLKATSIAKKHFQNKSNHLKA